MSGDCWAERLAFLVGEIITALGKSLCAIFYGKFFVWEVYNVINQEYMFAIWNHASMWWFAAAIPRRWDWVESICTCYHDKHWTFISQPLSLTSVLEMPFSDWIHTHRRNDAISVPLIAIVTIDWFCQWRRYRIVKTHIARHRKNTYSPM